MMINLNFAKRWLTAVFCLLCTISLNVFAEDSPAAPLTDTAQTVQSQQSLPDIGTYQIILEGVPGTGGLSYHLAFDTNGKVLIEKKFNGKDHSEYHQWTLDGKNITIHPLENGTVKDFDKATLTIIDEENIAVNLNVPGISLKILEKDVEFTLYKWHSFTAKFHIIFSLVVMLLLNELFRFVKWSGFVFFLGIAAVCTVFVWPYQGVVYWFKWAKIYSVVSAAVFFLLMRFTKVHQYKWAKMFCVFFLAVNIAEAATQDFTMGYLPNILNGIAGVLSILTCYYGFTGIKADNSPQKDMVWPKMTTLWIIAYDVWNFVYVYLNFPASASAQLMVIIAATIPALFIKKGTWLQARTYTLAAWFMYYFTFTHFYERNLWIFPRNDGLTYSLAALSLVLNIACVFQLVGFYKAKKRAQQQPATANA